MPLTYETWLTMRETVVKSCRPSRVEGMLAELSKLYPEHHYTMCMCKQLMRNTRTTDQEVACHA